MFSRFGYDSCEVDQIAAHAGIGKGTIYRHFRSKSELFLVVVDQGLARPCALMQQHQPSGRSLRERLRKGLTLLVDFFIDNPRLYRVLLIEQPAQRFRQDRTTMTRHQRFTAHLADNIKASVKAGGIRTVGPQFTAHCLVAIARVIIEMQLQRRKGVKGKHIEDAVDLLLRGIAK